MSSKVPFGFRAIPSTTQLTMAPEVSSTSTAYVTCEQVHTYPVLYNSLHMNSGCKDTISVPVEWGPAICLVITPFHPNTAPSAALRSTSSRRLIRDSPGGASGKEPTCNADARDAGSIPWLGRSPGRGHGNLLQCSCLENPHGQRSLAKVVFSGIGGPRGDPRSHWEVGPAQGLEPSPLSSHGQGSLTGDCKESDTTE